MKSFLLKDQKHFMNQLLKSELFDHFLLAEATIHGAVSYHVDGHINRAFLMQRSWKSWGLTAANTFLSHRFGRSAMS